VREEINPTILAVACLLTIVSVSCSLFSNGRDGAAGGCGLDG
jgi:hypothetical protein